MRPGMIFFDAGHTLLRPEPSLGGIYARITREFGVDVAPQRFEAAFGPIWDRHQRRCCQDPEMLRETDASNREMWRSFTRQLHESIPGLPPDFGAWFERLYFQFGQPEVWRPFDDVAEGLGRLRAAGHRLGILSNWDSRLFAILSGLGLDRQVDVIVVSSQVGWRKPHPEIFRLACEKARIEPGEALHVGDSLHDDVEGARAAGLRPVLIDRYGWKPASPAPVIRGLSDLMERGLVSRGGGAP